MTPQRTMLATTRYPALPAAPQDALPIVLVHGLSGEQSAWRPVLEDLRAMGEVITVDLPGFGGSPDLRGDWTFAAAGDAVVETLSGLGVGDFVLVGHSMGGGVSVRLAARHADRVAGLVLLAPAGWLGTGSGVASTRQAIVHAVWTRIARLGPSKLLRFDAVRDRVFSALVHDTSVIDREAAAELASGATRGRATPRARAATWAVQLLDDLPALTMPVHLVWGEEDRIVPVSLAPRIVERIADVRIDRVPGVGHIPMLECPDVVVGAVRDITSRVAVA